MEFTYRGDCFWTWGCFVCCWINSELRKIEYTINLLTRQKENLSLRHCQLIFLIRRSCFYFLNRQKDCRILCVKHEVPKVTWPRIEHGNIPCTIDELTCVEPALLLAVDEAAVLVWPVSEPVVLVLTAAGVALADSVEAVVLLPPVEDRWLVMTAAAASILSGI